MDKELLTKYVSEGLSTRKIAAKENLSQSTIKHWLKKYGLKTLPSIRKHADVSACNCVICDRPLIKRLATRGATKCDGCSQKQRRYLLRVSIVEYLGGKCNRCGWSGHISGYDIHHSDPSVKEFALSSPNNVSIARLKNEADKCELLCAICHRHEHMSYDDAFISSIKDLDRYSNFFGQ